MRKFLFVGVLFALALSITSMTTMAQAACSTSDKVAVSENADCVLDTGIGVGLTRSQEAVIINAANIFGNRFNGDNPAGVCLQGTGALYVSKASLNPRQAFFAWYYTTPEGFTCTNLSEPATVVLIEGTSPFAAGQAPASNPTSDASEDSDDADADSTPSAPTTSGTSTGGNFVLNNCTVVTRAILNFRDAPSTSSNVLDLIPYKAILKAINRDGDWFNVIFGDQNGWVAANLVNTRGKCS
jgi:uncharacterized protein YgiM (DUF1202 family)